VGNGIENRDSEDDNRRRLSFRQSDEGRNDGHLRVEEFFDKIGELVKTQPLSFPLPYGQDLTPLWDGRWDYESIANQIEEAKKRMEVEHNAFQPREVGVHIDWIKPRGDDRACSKGRTALSGIVYSVYSTNGI